jgi:hypothetical protein
MRKSLLAVILALSGWLQSTQYHIYGVRFATVAGLPLLHYLVLHADTTRKFDIAYIASTFAPGDTIMNLEAQDRMRRMASNPALIFPGHDPGIFIRYPKPGNGIAQIE